MNHDNRVLSRKGARTLTPQEVEHVTGSLRVQTQTACTLPFITGSTFDGDIGECGW